jgi:hypothetical protein
VVKGTYKKTTGRNGQKQKLEINIKIGKAGELVTQDNFDGDIGVLRAIFPGGAVCEMEGVGHSRKSFKYFLKAQVRKGVFSERFGFCEPNAMPVANDGDAIVIEFDEDDDAATTNVEVAKIMF